MSVVLPPPIWLPKDKELPIFTDEMKLLQYLKDLLYFCSDDIDHNRRIFEEITRSTLLHKERFCDFFVTFSKSVRAKFSESRIFESTYSPYFTIRYQPLTLFEIAMYKVVDERLDYSNLPVELIEKCDELSLYSIWET